MCRLKEGDVEMLSNSVLEDQDLADGWILSCQSVAKSTRLKIAYPDP
jgi:3-ketosteroid 9alpha-monooxygenase subunit B